MNASDSFHLKISRSVQEKMMRLLKYLPLVILSVFLAHIAGAEMYHWVDNQGVKHYTNSPPPEESRTGSSWDEIKSSGADDSDLKAREAAIIKETEAANRQKEIDAAAAKQEAASQEALDAKKAEKDALGESISNKRRYVKRRGKTDINKIKRLNQEIEALKQDKNADPEKIKDLEAEVQETKEKFYHKSGRGRKGTKEEVERHYQLEMEIQREEAKGAVKEKK
jgi:hypothetical protein